MTRASLSDRFFNLPQYLLPKQTLSALAYRLTRIQTPWFKHALIRAFVRQFDVDLSDAQITDIVEYPDFNAFFTRALRADARPLADAHHLLCPADGRISQIGHLDEDRLLQAKGMHYTLGELLTSDAWAARLNGGSFATIYLSPRDYHRVHMPTSGTLLETIHVPGQLFSVSPRTTRVVPRLFARNERLVSLFEGPHGPFALVMVGACNVGSMTTVWAGQVTPPYARRGQARHQRYDERAPYRLRAGEEMGRFNMGSTVIVVFAPGTLTWSAALRAEAPVRMGQALGQWREGSRS